MSRARGASARPHHPDAQPHEPHQEVMQGTPLRAIRKLPKQLCHKDTWRDANSFAYESEAWRQCAALSPGSKGVRRHLLRRHSSLWLVWAPVLWPRNSTAALAREPKRPRHGSRWAGWKGIDFSHKMKTHDGQTSSCTCCQLLLLEPCSQQPRNISTRHWPGRHFSSSDCLRSRSGAASRTAARVRPLCTLMSQADVDQESTQHGRPCAGLATYRQQNP